MIGRSVLLVVAVCLVGCAQTKEFVRPPMPVPNQWAKSAAEISEKGARTHWKSFFVDSQLLALIQTALDNNRDLRIAAGRVQEARALFGIARADLGPTFNLQGSGDLTRTSSDLTGTGAPLTSKHFDLSLSGVSFEFDFWGRVANLTEAARLSYLATEEAQRSVYLSLVADVALAYLALLQSEELIAGEQATVVLRERSLELIQKGKLGGAANDFDYQQALSLLESAQSTLANYVNQQEMSRNRLNFLIGNAPFDLKPGHRLDQQGLDLALGQGMSAEVLLFRPDVMAAERRLAATHANIAAARAAFLPRVALTAGLGFASQGLLALFSGGAWAFQPIISMPIFDGGRTAAGVDLAQARKVIAVAEYERAIQVAFREVADLLSTRASLARQVQSSDVNIEAQTRRLKIAQGRHELGAGSYLEVLDAQRELIFAQQLGVQLRRAQFESNVQLYKALGGGSENLS